MEIAIAGSTLPCSTLCHVVCTLVATGITGTNVTSPGLDSSVPATTQTRLPDGYIGYSDVGVAYKVHSASVNWTEARSRCTRDGARLALIDSLQKLQYVKGQKHYGDDAHVGIIRMFDTIWVDDATGQKLEALPWKSGYPSINVDCGVMEFSSTRLRNLNCSYTYDYVCEIPIIVSRENRMTIN